MNLNQYGQGEQTVSSALIAVGSAILNTNRPTSADNDVCTNSLGEARGYFVDLLNASGVVGADQLCGCARSGLFVGAGLQDRKVDRQGERVLLRCVHVGRRLRKKKRK